MKRILCLAAVLAAGFSLASLVRAETPATTPPKKESLELRFAKARFRFAEILLKRAEQLNSKVAETVPASIVSDLRRDSDLELRRVKAIEAGNANAEHEYWLNHLQSIVRESLAQLERAQAANRVTADAVDKLDVERLRVRAEIFQLLYDQGQQVSAKSPTDRLAWQNSVLLTEVELLNSEVLRQRMLSGDNN